MILNDISLYEVKGGAWTVSGLNAFSRITNIILELGRIVGSSISRIFTKNYC